MFRLYNLLKSKKSTIFKLLPLLIAGLFIVLVMVQSSKPFVLDEMDFPTVSRETSMTGRPIYYHSEQVPQNSGTYHPTMYINFLSAFIKTFGYSETTIRAFGLICVLLSAYLLIRIIRLLTKKNPTIEWIFLGVYLLNPYTIANATLPDIDPTVLPLVILLFIYVALRYVFKKTLFAKRTWIVLGLLFALALWAKLTTPLILPFFTLVLAWISSKKFSKSLLFTLKVTGLGIATFVSTYFIYCLALRLPLTYTYTFLWASFTKGTSSQGPIAGALHNITNFNTFIYWFTIPLVVVLGVSIIALLARKARDQKDKIKLLIVVTAILTTLFYIALLSPFGGYFKYPFPVFGLLLLSIVFMYDRYLSEVKLNNWLIAVAFVFGFIVEKTLWGDSMFLTHRSMELSTLIGLILVAVTIYILLVKPNTKNILAMFLVLLLSFSVGFQLSISRAQAIAPYPTKYLYGQLGLADTAAYLRANTGTDEVIWSMKDVGQYAQRRHQESYAYYFDASLNTELVNMLKEGKIRYYITTTGIGEDNIDYYKNVKDDLNTYATKVKQFDNFIIYKANSTEN